MTAASITVDPKRKWYGLALRHHRMANRLLNLGFSDGAVFHAYHAYECVLSALIAAFGYDVPPDGWTTLKLPTGRTVRFYPSPSGQIKAQSAHKARIQLFDELANQTSLYYPMFQALSRMITVDDRNNALYYDVTFDLLPQQRFPQAFAISLINALRRFEQEVWSEIR